MRLWASCRSSIMARSVASGPGVLRSLILNTAWRIFSQRIWNTELTHPWVQVSPPCTVMRKVTLNNTCAAPDTLAGLGGAHGGSWVACGIARGDAERARARCCCADERLLPLDCLALLPLESTRWRPCLSCHEYSPVIGSRWPRGMVLPRPWAARSERAASRRLRRAASARLRASRLCHSEQRELMCS